MARTSDDTTMLHIRVPKSIVQELDKLIQEHPEIAANRTQFIIKMLKDTLQRNEISQSLKSSSGALRHDEGVDWAGVDSVQWVQEQRRRGWTDTSWDS